MAMQKRALAAAAMVIALSLAPGAASGQGLPDAALRLGFAKATGKRIGAFSASSLAGTTLDGNSIAGEPALFHVWSALTDPTGEALALIAALRRAAPGALIIALSPDKAQRIEGIVARAGLDASLVAAEARTAILALGGPPPPSWIFVSPAGEIAAYRLGRIDPDAGLVAIEALFEAYRLSVGKEPSRERPPASVKPESGSIDPVSPSAPPIAQSMEEAIIQELNLARTRPSLYADVLREYRKFIRGNYLERPGETTVVLNEGVKAVDEAIAYLERQEPVPPLALSPGLSKAASDHARDQGKTGQTGHTGSDRSTMSQRAERYGSWIKTLGENIAYGAETARDVVIQLIVDDGVASRGHRTNVFNPAFLVVGVSFGKHPKYRTICVQDFAGGFEPR
ncbi:MAG: CAP domain-containing protein [Spirochaetes bacterium]|nr:CAP domain-containing protein [Spirochaetota bacterium]MBU1080155.1 CAP domain-containing protein [Spirochaetota bacterium]